MINAQEIKLISIKRIFVFLLLVLLHLPQVHSFAEASKLPSWKHAGYLILLSFFWTYLLMPFLIKLSFKIGLLDKPDESRKTHKQPTSLAGGVAIYIAFALTILFNFHFSLQMKAILVASAIIFTVGLIDDIGKISAKVRLLGQLVAASILIYYGVRVTFVPDWMGGIFTEIVITLIWLIGITNSMNFIDGINGLASGSCIIYCVFFAIVSIITKQTYMMFLVVTVAGSCLGFFIYNFRYKKPAWVFLGDSGSTFLGFFLASIAILGEWGNSIVDITIPVLIMSVLIFDMTLTTIVRIYTGEVKTFGQWIHYTGRDHLHHRLSDLGLGDGFAALVIFGVSICFGLEALVLKSAHFYESIILLLHSAMAFFIIAVVLIYRKNGKLQQNIFPLSTGGN